MQKNLIHFFSLLLCYSVIHNVKAKHIIGGDLQYECLGDGRYRITMKIYRDCRSQVGPVASFDGDGDGTAGAYIALYQGNNTFRLMNVYIVPLKSQSSIEAPDFPCLIPPNNLCVEQGIYELEIDLPEWPSASSYHLVYQRCCRNTTISNIVAPGDIGATYHIEITPQAQASCNNSPAFSQFPPTVICVDADIGFDHSAVDQEGDSLVYRFCYPLKGGGRRGLGQNSNPGDAARCDGIRPNPPCQPPFSRVAFGSSYSFSAPMAGKPAVKIDERTGLISGKPQTIGQFVMAVCVEEYRDGVQIGEIRRDFQFNVADCDPTVFAKLKSDATLGQQEFIINSCGNNTILFENESGLVQYIDSYRWEFDINGDLKVLDSRDAEVTFPGIGTYRGVMMVNPGLDCGDTADIYVNLYPSIDADFSFDYDTCIGGPTTFRDLSVTGAMQITSWQWEFGEGGTSDRQHPTYTYPIPGDHPVSLTVTDDNECADTKTVPIRYFPVPALVVVEPSTFTGCSPAEILFNNLSTPIDSTYIIAWDFGDGGTSDDLSPFYAYEAPGVYDVNISITSPIGCFTSASFPNWIRVRQSPVADFTFLPEEPSNFNPTVDFTNLSSNHIGQRWIFGEVGQSQEPSPTFSFPDTGRYLVQLIALHENGCMDTSIQEIYVLPRVTYHMPNAFTPNGDGKNDEFLGIGYTAGMQDFEVTIWNRWGELLFRSEDPQEGWDGNKQSTGQPLPIGVYVYQVHFINPMGDFVELKGFATLVR